MYITLIAKTMWRLDIQEENPTFYQLLFNHFFRVIYAVRSRFRLLITTALSRVSEAILAVS